ncbi:hypothetical protein P3T73_10905 [Kiritimatiellota bacterium B12222]|nr:hypothetical protein P3T73_10905 [Kiritimatiellota bacterium B12222]
MEPLQAPSPFNEGGTLGGSGNLNGLVTVAGTLAPGESPGTLHFTNDLTLKNSASLNIEITGINPGAFDILNGNGSNTLIIDGILALDNTGYTGVRGDSITIFTNWDTVSGTFSSITGTDLEDGLEWDTRNIYSTGSMTVIPEPSSVTLLLLSFLAMITQHYKSQKK